MHSNHWNAGTRPRMLLLALALLLAPLSLAATPALAAPSCATSGATVTCTFSYTGAAQTWTVPAGITAATVELIGAPGAAGNNVTSCCSTNDGGPGGKGARVSATLPLLPGSALTVVVGGPGTVASGGFNGGGGNSGFTVIYGGGGGGASDIRIDGADLDHRVLVAGGGGGGGGSVTMFGAVGGAGGAADTSGGDGNGSSGLPGGCGGASGNTGGQGGAGAAGTLSTGTAGRNGSPGLGGIGGTPPYLGSATPPAGGGGGGGYYGGGGGGSGADFRGASPFSGAGGGGGGSSFAASQATDVTVATDDSGIPQVIITYVLDRIAPTASPTQSPAANSAGWNNTDVAVSWNWADNTGGLGLDPTSCTTSSSSSGEGAQTLSASCADLAGNTGSASYSVKVDKTAPSISAAATTQPNSNGWYTGDVTVAFSCQDATSGIPSGACPASQTLSGEGASISSTAQSVSDAAGNSATSNVVTVAIDRSAPSVSVTGVTNGASYPLGSVPAAGCSTSDALSGVATPATLSISGGNADGTGSFTASCSGATDNAGNSGSASASYTVAYRWSGFFQPVDNLPTVNSAKAGSSIPVKFSLGGNYGLNIFATGYPKVQTVACTTGAPTDEIEQTVTAGASSLSYDAATGQYSYTWKTDKAWANTCRQLTVRLVDGTDHVALFQFK